MYVYLIVRMWFGVAAGSVLLTLLKSWGTDPVTTAMARCGCVQCCCAVLLYIM